MPTLSGEPVRRADRLRRAFLCGLALGLAGALLGVSPAGMKLEEDLALGWLFRLRGPLPPPDDVVLIAVDRASQRALGLPRQYRMWPRGQHAALVRRLPGAGPRLIVYDIFFAGEREGDAALADAFRRAGRVLLAQRVEKERTALGGRDAVALEIETLVHPAGTLADAAAAVAPFVLPAAPGRVGQVWTFRPESGDAPTLPAAATQLGALDLYPHLRRVLTRLAPGLLADLPADAASLLASPGLAETMRRLRLVLHADPRLAAAARAAARSTDGLADADRARLAALIDLYARGHGRHVKYYGPPGTIESLSFERVLAMDAAGLEHFRGRAVFIGVVAAPGSEQEDIFYTPYPGKRQDIFLSGVEVAATAYANLLRNESIHPLGPAGLLTLHLAWGLLVGVLACLPPARLAPAGVVLAAAGWSLAVHLLFAHHDLWLPWVVPVGAQALPALLLGLWLAWREEARRRRRIAAAIDRYLPGHVARELAAGISRAGVRGRLLEGVCIATDGERYTTLAERLDPRALHGLLTDYYAVLFEPIRRSGGFVSDVVGDACLGLWIGSATSEMVQTRRRACEAAIDLLGAVEAFNTDRPDGGIPTRVGLHAGEIFLGDVGAADHYEYRAVGDVVNTATRIEQLCRQLGTRLLVSAPVLEGIDGLVTRDLGLFRLAGKRHAVHVYELLGRADRCDPATADFVADFERALDLMQRGEWAHARKSFAGLLERRPEDGPSRFFARLCEDPGARPPAQDGCTVVELDAK